MTLLYAAGYTITEKDIQDHVEFLEKEYERLNVEESETVYRLRAEIESLRDTIYMYETYGVNNVM